MLFIGLLILQDLADNCEQLWQTGCFLAELYTDGLTFWRSLATGEYYSFDDRAAGNSCPCVMSSACDRGEVE